jgi:glycosyltransferase involved in cell wall biosynthesis
MGEHKRRARRPGLTVTIAIPTIPGREALLERAVLSARSQTRKADAVLVETDPERTGAWATRNRLLARVDTDVIAWLDDDDTLRPQHLRSCMRALEQSAWRPDLVYPRPRMVGGPDPTALTHQGVFPVSPWGLRWSPEHAAHLRHHGSFIPMTHLVRTEYVRRIGGFRAGYTLESGRYRGEDEDYLIRLMDAGSIFEHLDEVTWNWNVHSGHTAGRGAPA